MNQQSQTQIEALTSMDRAIIAHDFLNPDIADNYRAAPVAMMADDRRDYQVMRARLHSTARFEGYDAEGLACYSNVVI